MRGGRKYNNKYNKYSNKDKKNYVHKTYDKNVHLSKFLALVLRHKAKDFGLEVEPSGFIKLDDIISLPQSQKNNMTLDKVKEIVANDQKGRYELVNRPPYYIRAVQGHSMSEVSNEDTMYKLNKKNIFDFPTVVHGTQEALNCEIFIEINPLLAFFNGYEFFISQNKVVLCPGNEEGYLPMEFVKRVKNKNNICVYKCLYEILIKYENIEGKNNFEIFREEKSVMKSNEPNESGQFIINKELIKEKVIVIVNEKDEQDYIKFIKENVENGNIIYPALFVDYLIGNDEKKDYTSELLKKVDINWNEFYNKKDYKKEKEEEEKEEKKETNKEDDKNIENEDD